MLRNALLVEDKAAVLDDGKRYAKQRRDTERVLSRVGLGCAAIAGLCTLPKPISRRRMLRLAVGGSEMLVIPCKP